MSISSRQSVGHYVRLWHLEVDGNAQRTHSSLVVPVVHQGVKAMLKIVRREGVVRLLEHDGQDTAYGIGCIKTVGSLVGAL